MWYVSYTVDGVQCRRSLKTKNLKQARRLAAAIDAKLVLGELEIPIKRTRGLEDPKEEYLNSVRLRCDPKTAYTYARDLGEFVAACLKEYHVSRWDMVSATVLERHQTLLTTTGLAGVLPNPPKRRRQPNMARTVRCKMTTIRQAIKFMVRRGLLRKDPAAGYDLPPKVKEETYCWTPEQLRQLLRLSTGRFSTSCASQGSGVTNSAGFLNRMWCWTVRHPM